MTIPKFYIIFNLKLGDKNTKWLSPIRCRLTFNRQRKDFSIGLFVDPNYWDAKKERLLDQPDQEEIVSELLGHTKLATTQQSYDKIVQKKVGEEMRRLRRLRDSPF